MLDDNGFLADRGQWSPEVAKAFAELENVQLTDAHWEVLTLIQAFYDEYDASPANRALVNYVKAVTWRGKRQQYLSNDVISRLPNTSSESNCRLAQAQELFITVLPKDFAPQAYDALLNEKISAIAPRFNALGAPSPKVFASSRASFRMRTEFAYGMTETPSTLSCSTEKRPKVPCTHRYISHSQ
jgi:tRNA 2-thiouridine synthesizing protein E